MIYKYSLFAREKINKVPNYYVIGKVPVIYLFMMILEYHFIPYNTHLVCIPSTIC